MSLGFKGIFLLYARFSTSHHRDVYVQKSCYFKISRSGDISAIAFWVGDQFNFRYKLVNDRIIVFLLIVEIAFGFCRNSFVNATESLYMPCVFGRLGGSGLCF